MRTIVGLLVVACVILLGIGTVLIPNSPYDPDIAADRSPFASERPAIHNQTMAAAYIITYEQTRLRNDLLGTRGFELDMHDEVQADCTTISTNRAAAGGFRVRLRCHGDIKDGKQTPMVNGYLGEGLAAEGKCNNTATSAPYTTELSDCTLEETLYSYRNQGQVI